MELLKVLLVDDENLVIEDMLTLIDWESNGFSVAGYAYNGSQSLKLIQKINPDIIFMDVSLPDIDGIRLSKKLLEISPDIIIIILSGYMDFTYAQGAVEIGALSYLVKHQMTPERLIDVLHAARETHEKRQLSQILSSRQLLRDILEQNIPLSSDILNHLTQYKDSFLILQLSPLTPYQYEAKEDAFVVQPHFSSLLKIKENEMHVLDILIYHSSFLVFIYLNPDAKAGKRYLSSLNILIKKLLDELKNTTLVPFFAVHLDCETTLTSLHDDCGYLEAYREDYIFYPNKNILTIGRRIKEKPCSPDLTFINKDSFLSNNLTFCQQLTHCLESLAHRKDAMGFYNCCDLTRKMMNDFPIDYKRYPSECIYSHDISRQLIEECINLYASYQVLRQYSPSTSYIIQYIHKNYNQNPSLAEASSILSSNPMYLGQKFRKETGKIFHDYLNEFRIDKAKELLQGTNLKIFEISDLVGINNSQYFSKIFKELTNVTPNEYRLKHFAL